MATAFGTPHMHLLEQEQQVRDQEEQISRLQVMIERQKMEARDVQLYQVKGGRDVWSSLGLRT